MGDRYVEIDLDAGYGDGTLAMRAVDELVARANAPKSTRTMIQGPRCSNCGRLIDHPGRCEPCRIADPDSWLTKRQAADVAQVTPRTIQRWIHDHGLEGGGPGDVRILRRDLDDFLRRHRRAG